jgi:hypothetical protein
MSKYISGFLLLVTTIFISLGSNSCKKEKETGDTIQGWYPTVETSEIKSLTGTSVKCGGNITSDGNNQIIQRGVCWNTKPYPTISDSLTLDYFGTGSFESAVKNLEPNTTYFLRAYAVNKKGVSYGLQQTFKTAELKIGDFYQGGIVFYINKSSDIGYEQNHVTGYVSNGVLENIKKKWGCTGNYIDSTSDAQGFGYLNTNRILQKCNDTNSAANYCTKLKINSYNGWFLPSASELILCQNYFNAPSNWWYWSSTEFGADDAYPMIGGKITGYVSKNLEANIIPIKKFKTK